MRLSGLARRYAAALFEAARGSNTVDSVESDLGLITYSLDAAPRLREMLVHPLIPAARKKELVSEIFKGKIQDVTLDFLFLLVDKQREEIVAEVETEYVNLANDYRKIATVQVTSAVPLTADEQAQLREKLGKFTGKTVELELSENLELIGGLIVQIGDTVIDGSVKGYLAGLREKLLGKE
jgi:F-type H+-transporting ATPase subunit delta